MTTPTSWTDEERATWRYACTLSGMRNWWKGSVCVVVGGGPSAMICYPDMPTRSEYANHWTIGCNRSVSFCQPDFAACFEPRKDDQHPERGEVWELIQAASVPFVLSHITRDHPRCILTPSKDAMREAAGTTARFGQSPYFAVYCAIMLGFETVGIIGVDLTRDRYPRKLQLEEKCYAGLRRFAGSQGCRLINLNPRSRLTVIERGTWGEVRRK